MMANEKRLIDANAFLKALNERPLDFLDVGGDFGYFDETIDSVVDGQPTVDTVEVVRCRDCKHKGWIPGPIHGKHVHYCGVWERTPGNINTTFCSYGERRTDG